jgi:hypothetical protein
MKMNQTLNANCINLSKLSLNESEKCFTLNDLKAVLFKIECKGENHRIDELNSDINMTVIVCCILLLLYLIVFIVYYKCAPNNNYKTVDEMLETLPSRHVMLLKQLVLDREHYNDENGNINVKGSVTNQRRRLREQIRDPIDSIYDKTRTKSINYGFEVDPNDVKMSNLKRSSISLISDLTTQTNNEKHMNLNLTNKINDESKRRLSVKPFKKIYSLNAIDSSSSSSLDELN